MHKVRHALLLVGPAENGWTIDDSTRVREELKRVGADVEDVLLHDAEVMVVKCSLKRSAMPGLEGELKAALGNKLTSHSWCECATDEPFKEVRRRRMRMDAPERVADHRLVGITASAVGSLDY